MKRKPKTLFRHNYHFPERQGNEAVLLVDGENYFPAILQDIAEAKKTVFIELYLVHSGKITDLFIDALTQAAARQVGVFMLLDAFGASKLQQADRQHLSEAGVHLAVYNPFRLSRLRRSLHRTHRKIIVIDNTLAYTGGAGISDLFAPGPETGQYWHDTMTRIQGPCVNDWTRLFRENWVRWSTIDLPACDTCGARGRDGCGRVVTNQSARRSEIRKSLITHIYRAQRRIWLATPYFVPSRRIRRLLAKAARRGIDTRLLLPGPLTDNPGSRYMARRFYGQLLKGGVRIYEFQPRFLHAKLFLVDDWASVGSSNMDRWGLIWNLDANQEIQQQKFAAQLEECFNRDFQRSESFVYEKWCMRPWHQRLLELLWGRVMAILSWFSSGVETLEKR